MKYYLDAPFFMGGSNNKAKKQAAEIRKRDPKMGHEAYISIYDAEEKYDLAEKEYIALIKKDPANFDYHNKHVWFYINHKDYENAYKKLVKMIQNYPENDWPYYSVGYIGFVSGTHLDYAEECMQKLFDIISSGRGNTPKPRLAWLHFMLGTIYKKDEKKDLAKNEYEIALALNPYLKEAREVLNEM
jgi:Tfp pilus assembly protein PilF